MRLAFDGGIAWLGQEALRHRHSQMRFRSLFLCEREVFVISNGFHAFSEPASLEPVRHDSEVTVCPWPRKA